MLCSYALHVHVQVECGGQETVQNIAHEVVFAGACSGFAQRQEINSVCTLEVPC